MRARAGHDQDARDGQGPQHAARGRPRRRRPGHAERRRPAADPLHEHLRPGPDLDHLALPGPGHAAAGRPEPHLRRRELHRRDFDGGGGGAIFARGGRLRIVNSTFVRNRCDPTGPDLGGGAVRVLSQYHGLPVYVVGSRFTANVCSNGGALSSIGVSWTSLNSRFTDNRAIGHGANPARAGTPGGGSGGAIYNDGNHFTLTVAGCHLTGNHAARGRRGDLLRQQRPHRHAARSGQRPAAQPQRRLRDRRPARHLLPRRRPARDRRLRPALSVSAYSKEVAMGRRCSSFGARLIRLRRTW